MHSGMTKYFFIYILVLKVTKYSLRSRKAQLNTGLALGGGMVVDWVRHIPPTFNSLGSNLALI